MKEQSLDIPTYLVGAPDKDPIFYTGRTYQGAQGHIYPHPLYNILTDVKKDVPYRVVTLENKYIRLVVSPQLGGRILSALDKTDNYDFFYHQHVIKPALIGMIGAWISGGVEWNIPDHHRASSMLPVDYALEDHDDGSKTVWVGETELSRGLKWRVGLTLAPDRSYIEATIKIFNNTPFAQSFLYWANVSVHANENYQVIFPPGTRFGVQHAKSEFTTWPVGSGSYGGADMKDVNLSWWKNIPTPLSVFAWNFTDDFLAGYDFGKNAGTVHVANHHIVTGKKFFAWGNNADAAMWDKKLTDTDGAYLELMVGAYSDNQPDYSWINPGETRVFHQYWYPIQKIGGVKNATINAAVNLERIAADSIRVGFCTTTALNHAQAVILLNNTVYKKETFDIDPADPYNRSFSIPSVVNDTAIAVALYDQQGHELVSYKPVHAQEEEMPKPVNIPKSPKEYASGQELYLTGMRLEQFRNASLSPLPYYEEALRRDSLDYLVNNALGMICCKEGRFAEAVQYYRRSLKRLTENYTKPKDGEAFYYMGISLQFLHRYEAAADAFWKATWYNAYQSSAYLRLAQLECIRHNYDKALTLIDHALETNKENPDLITLKAYILRKTGNAGDAARLCESAQSIDHLDNWSACELYFTHALLKRQDKWDAKDDSVFIDRLHGNVQSVLELAIRYGDIGAYNEAIRVLSTYHHAGAAQADLPLLLYYLGYYENKSGNMAEAKRYFDLAANSSPDYCFPSRLQEIDILGTAIQLNPADVRACYYLGNLHYYLNQKDKAIADWERSATLDDRFYLTFRNLGFAYSHFSHDYRKAIPAYEKAISLNSQDPRLFTELDVVRENAGISPSERLGFFQKYIPVIMQNDDAVTRLVQLYIATGAYDEALRILTTRHIHVWEGSRDIHEIFVDANLLKGIQEMGNKQYTQAVRDFERATTYPDNLEVGKPYDGGRSTQVYYYLASAYEQKHQAGKAKQYYKQAAFPYFQTNVSDMFYYRAMALKKMGDENSANELLGKLEGFANKLLMSKNDLAFFSKFGSDENASFQLADIYYLLGLAYDGKGESTEATAQFKKALELNPDHLWAKVMLDKDRKNE